MIIKHRLLFLLIFSAVASVRSYLFPGCEIKPQNSGNTTKDVLSAFGANWDITPLKIHVIQPGKILGPITVPMPLWTWTPLLIDLKKEVVISPHINFSFPSAEDSQGHHQLTENPFKEIRMLDAHSVIDCPQGLPYRILQDDQKPQFSFPYPPEKKGEQTYLLFALSQVEVGLSMCAISACRSSRQVYRLCYDEDGDQLKAVKMELGDSCPKIPTFRHFKMKLRIEKGQVKMMNEVKMVLANLRVAEDEDIVHFALLGTQEHRLLIVIQCFHSECISLETEKTNDRPQNDEDGESPDQDGGSLLIAGFFLPYLIIIMLGFALSLQCVLRRHQINQLRAGNARQMPTVTFHNAPNSSAAGHSLSHSTDRALTHPSTPSTSAHPPGPSTSAHPPGPSISAHSPGPSTSAHPTGPSTSANPASQSAVSTNTRRIITKETDNEGVYITFYSNS